MIRYVLLSQAVQVGDVSTATIQNIFSPSAFEVEHIIPRSAGGLTESNNLALACSHCNAHKASRRMGFDPHTETEVRLFNPRIDNWIIHFFLNRDTGEIQGKITYGPSNG